ncbi:MAG: cold shock domain-containing protein [Ardenticatenaceae bacterium]|nr:cold shock domain-containing protein [Anaerolineales bacterium]MCB8923035.1 cold shock domain-containing protein [Ardenticatenaceae bacterium]
MTEPQPIYQTHTASPPTPQGRHHLTTGHTGQVKWFNAEKGFGFIVPDDPELTAVYDDEHQDIFVHYSAIDGHGYRALQDGDWVKFDLVDKGRGPQAQNVRILRHS